MDRRWIRLTSISGKGIRSFALFQNPPLYAIISVNGRQRQTTPPAQTGGENPVWESPVRIDLGNEPDLVLEFDLMAKGNLLLGGDKIVGKVNVPVNDLMTEGMAGTVRHVSYQVTSPEGKPNGVLSFSYNFNQPPPRQMDLPIPSPPGTFYPPAPSALYPPLVSYYPPPPPPPPLPEHVPYCPPPMHMPMPSHGHVSYYPPSEYVTWYPPSIADPAGCYRPPAEDPTCWYPPPPHDPYSYRPENWDRRLY